MRKLHTIFSLLLLSLVVLSCKKDKPEPPAVKIDVLELLNGDNLRFGEDIRIDLAATGNPFITSIRVLVSSDVEDNLIDANFVTNTTHYRDTIIIEADDFVSEGTQFKITVTVNGTNGNALGEKSIPYIGDSLVLRGMYFATERYIYDYSFASSLYSKIQITPNALIDYWEVPNLLVVADTNSVSVYSPKTKSFLWKTDLTYDMGEKTNRLFVQGKDILVVSDRNRFTFLNEQGGVTKTEIPKDVKQIVFMDLGDDYIFIQDTAETYFLQNTSLIKTISFGGVYYEDIQYVGKANFLYSDTNRLNIIESNTSFSNYLAFLNQRIHYAQRLEENTILFGNDKSYFRLITTTGVITEINKGKITTAYKDYRSGRILAIANSNWLIHASSFPYDIQITKPLSDFADKPTKIFPKYQP